MTAMNYTGYIVFADLKGFSKMDESKFEEYAYTLRALDKTLEAYKKMNDESDETSIRADVWNTWGDALLAVFKSGIDAAQFMLTYREFFQKNRALDLEPRIAAHYGGMKRIKDPMLNGAYNVLGYNVNMAARIEPITFPGEIYVTKEFKEQFEHEAQQVGFDEVMFQDLKEWELAKNFTDTKVQLYRLFHIKEQAWNINELFIEKGNTTLDSLYGVIDMNDELERELEKLRLEISDIANKDDMRQYIKSMEQQSLTGPKLFAMAKIEQEIGCYDEALNHIEQSLNWNKTVDPMSQEQGIVTRPLRHNIMLLKLKADCLSKSNRPQRYTEAKRILYEVLQMDPKNNDTLCKLAAQMKREAFVQAEDQVDIAKQTLKKSLDLYLEAFRLKGDYYPAINAAYIKRIINADDSWQLANYIVQTWQDETDKDWWIDSTLAESQMLMKDYRSAILRLKRAIYKHNPNFSELEATALQIEMYSKMLSMISDKQLAIEEQKDLDEIIDILKTKSKELQGAN